MSAFRWTRILEMGGDERQVRSVVATRIVTDFGHDDFRVRVFRRLVAQPMLDAVHRGPIIDYLNDKSFDASVPNPNAHSPGEPLRLPLHPKLTMKRRDPDGLPRSVNDWHGFFESCEGPGEQVLGAIRHSRLPSRGGRSEALAMDFALIADRRSGATDVAHFSPQSAWKSQVGTPYVIESDLGSDPRLFVEIECLHRENLPILVTVRGILNLSAPRRF